MARQFRELSSSVARMATLAEQGRITLAVAEEEIMLLKELAAHDIFS